MKLKNLFKAVIATAIAIVGFFAVINIGPRVEAASEERTIASDGNSDYGFYRGKVLDVKNYYDDYVSGKNFENRTINGTDNHMINSAFENYSVLGERIYLYGYDDPITAFVDKYYLKNPGDYIMYGNEYGYYVHTICLNSAEDCMMSTILLFDFSVTKGSVLKTNRRDTRLHFKVNVISQTAVVTMNYNVIRESCSKGYNNYAVNLPTENGSGNCVMYYYLGANAVTPKDGFLVAPVLSSNYTKNGCPQPAQYDQILATDISLATCFTDNEDSFSVIAKNCKDSTTKESLLDEHDKVKNIPFSDLTLGLHARKLKFNNINDEDYKAIVKNTIANRISEASEKYPEEVYGFFVGESVNYIASKVIPFADEIQCIYDYLEFNSDVCDSIINNIINDLSCYFDGEGNYKDLNNELVVTEAGRGFVYNLNSFGDFKDFSYTIFGNHADYVDYEMDYNDSILDLKLDYCFKFTPLIKEWAKDIFQGTKYCNYVTLTNVQYVSRNEIKSARSVTEVINVENIYETSFIEDNFKIEKIDELRTAVSFNCKEDNFYNLKINPSDNVRIKAIIWDETSKEFVTQSGYGSYVFMSRIHLQKNHKYHIELIYDNTLFSNEIESLILDLNSLKTRYYSVQSDMQSKARSKELFGKKNIAKDSGFNALLNRELEELDNKIKNHKIHSVFSLKSTC